MFSTNDEYHEWKIDRQINRNSSPKKNLEHRLKKICPQNCRWNQWPIHEIRSNYYHCLSNPNCEEFFCWPCCSNSITFNPDLIISWAGSLRKICNFVSFSLFSTILTFFHLKWSFARFWKLSHGSSFPATANFLKNADSAKATSNPETSNSGISNSDFPNSKTQNLKTTSSLAVSGTAQKISKKYSTNNSIRQCSDFWIFQFRLHLFSFSYGPQRGMKAKCDNNMTKSRLKIFTHFASARRDGI